MLMDVASYGEERLHHITVERPCTNPNRDQFHYGLSNNNYSCIINNVYSVYNVTVDLHTNAEIIALLMGLGGISPGTFNAMFQTVFMVLIN